MRNSRAIASRTPLHRDATNTFLILLGVALANEVFDWRLVGNYDWELIIAMTMLGGLLIPLVLLTSFRR